ncbi:MAG: NADH-quinone oxidoreductase subunit NuoE [Nitrospirota bacterium]
MMNTLKKRDESKVNKILKRYSGNGSVDLMGILQSVQGEYGYVPRPVVEYIADELDIYPSKIYGVITFYSQFALKPKGKNVIKVCRGTACHVKGSLNISKKIQDMLNINEGDTTEDMLFTLEHVACVGACAKAPLAVINDNVYGKISPDEVKTLIDDIAKGK